MYPSISKTVIRILRCRNIDGASYLLSDFSVRCDQDEYSRYYGLAVFFTILYPIGIPGLFTYVLARNRHKLPPDWWPQGMDEEEDKASTAYRNIRGNEWAERATWREEVWNPRMAYCAKMDTRFGFLFNAYTGQFWWFESVMSAYKLAMTTLIIFVASDGPGSTELRILFSMFMATCLMAVVAFLQPFKDADVLSVETMSNLELLFVLFAALYLALVPSAAMNPFFGLLLVVLLLLPLVAVGALLVRSVRQEMAVQRARSSGSLDKAQPTRSLPMSAKSTFNPAASRRNLGNSGGARGVPPPSVGKLRSKRGTTFMGENPMMRSSKNLSGNGSNSSSAAELPSIAQLHKQRDTISTGENPMLSKKGSSIIGVAAPAPAACDPPGISMDRNLAANEQLKSRARRFYDTMHMDSTETPQPSPEAASTADGRQHSGRNLVSGHADQEAHAKGLSRGNTHNLLAREQSNGRLHITRPNEGRLSVFNQKRGTQAHLEL